MVEGADVEKAWHAGLEVFRDSGLLQRHESERGVAFDIPCLTLIVQRPTDSAIPDAYAHPTLVDDYLDRMFGVDRDRSLLHQRLFAWERLAGGVADQVELAVETLRRDPESRAAVFSLWRADADPGSAFPVSPVAGCLRVIRGSVHLFVVARSVDFWIGAVPELLALTRLLEQVAVTVHRPVGEIIYHMWSAHIYEEDWLAHVSAGS